MGLLGRIVAAIVLGVALGHVTPLWGVRVMATFGEIFSQFLGFMIPLIIVGFVSPAIADLGKQAGRMLVFTALLAYAFTLFSGFASYFTGAWLFPSLITPSSVVSAAESVGEAAEPFFSVSIPALMPVMTALVLAFMLGLGTAFVDGTALRNGLGEFRSVVDMTIRRVVIPLLPVYIFGIFLNMTAEGKVASVLSTFVGIIAVIFVMHVLLLLIQYGIAACFSGGNPLKMLRSMLPAYFTALGTQSSAATIPVTLEQTIRMGVSRDVAGFTVPLCATIHMSGSTMKIVSCALAIMIMHGIPYSAGSFAYFIAMLGVTIIAAPGIPGGAIMASLGLLSSILGFYAAQCSLMIALYIAMDSFGTACNVTGDGAIAVIVDRCFNRKSKKIRRE